MANSETVAKGCGIVGSNRRRIRCLGKRLDRQMATSKANTAITEHELVGEFGKILGGRKNVFSHRLRSDQLRNS